MPKATPFCFLLSLLSTAALSAAETVDFNRDVRPILSDKCFACHGPDAKQVQGDLRLDLRESATRLTDGKAAIVVGKPEASELVARIRSTDPEVRMPPEKSGKKLTAAEKDVLTRWIAAGAEYQRHWAFVAPVRPEPPQISAAGYRVYNPIDAFVAARLQAAGLKMAPEADKATLIRRLALDLNGLPPTPAEVDAFLADTAPDAYERLVDRLLASPRFGERMAMWWLDGARYADSNGYQADYERFMWPWRDWVINAFNRNMPFDQFTIEQMAGDLLPNATVDQKIATGFHRNHRINTEGGIIAEEWRIETVIDRVETTSAVWLGLTMGCARCHNHKYDPVTQKDFYRMFAFFNNVPESGIGAERPINHPPVLRADRPEDKPRLAELDRAVAAAEARVRELTKVSPEAQERWEQEELPLVLAASNAWMLLEVQAEATSKAKFALQGDGSYLVSGPMTARDVYQLTAQMPPGPLVGIGLHVLPDASLANQSFGRAGNGNIVLSKVEAEIVVPGEPPQPLTFASAKADYSQHNWHITAAIDGKPGSGWALDGNAADKRLERHAMFLLDKPLPLPQGGKLVVRLRHEALASHNIGRFRLLVTGNPFALVSEANAAPAALLAAAKIPANERTAEQKAAVTELYKSRGTEELALARKNVESAKKAKGEYEASIPSVMVLEEMPKPRKTLLLIRGQYDKPGEEVTAGLPAALPAMPAGQPLNRLGLARWLVSPEQPLTARVQVNRYWELLFGMGLVKSSENFGLQSEFPSHPELLDWLATEYLRLGWDTKQMLKTIVTSATYRQSSRVTPEALARDPENRLLARGSRFRLQAELVRDNALAISGLLVERQGGPSVRPYQPLGVWDDTTEYGNLRNYKHDKGPGLYRRSLYTIWKRTAAPPDMMLFDMPARELCVVKRSRTNTPLQALTLLNDVTYVEAARVFAERMLREGGAKPADRIAFGFRCALARGPQPAEMATLRAGFDRALAHFRERRTAANDLIAVGETKPNPQFDAVELAAYTMTASVILNLDETITKE